MPVLKAAVPIGQRLPGLEALDQAFRTEAATAEVKLLQSRERPALRNTLRQPRRHYAAPASSDDARIAPANKDLLRLAQVTAPSDGLVSRRATRLGYQYATSTFVQWFLGGEWVAQGSNLQLFRATSWGAYSGVRLNW